mmetsp:Transcript_51521/g.95310  ORF Transcript_51521/g.95310 Transcript_51521/m.95310 type:complete len:143 (-) Transcript_51521:305-733(-)
MGCVHTAGMAVKPPIQTPDQGHVADFPAEVPQPSRRYPFRISNHSAQSLGSSMELSSPRKRLYATSSGTLAPDFEMTSAHVEALEKFLLMVQESPSDFAEYICRARGWHPLLHEEDILPTAAINAMQAPSQNHKPAKVVMHL